MSDPNFFLSRLNGEPHALAFGGQSTPWPVALADLTNDPALEATLRGHVAAANTMLAPVAADLLATTGRPAISRIVRPTNTASKVAIVLPFSDAFGAGAPASRGGNWRCQSRPAIG